MEKKDVITIYLRSMKYRGKSNRYNTGYKAIMIDSRKTIGQWIFIYFENCYFCLNLGNKTFWARYNKYYLLLLCDVRTPGERLSWNSSPQFSIFGHLRTVLHAGVGPLLNVVCPCSSRSASASFAIHFPLYNLLYDGVVSLDVAKKDIFLFFVYQFSFGFKY